MGFDAFKEHSVAEFFKKNKQMLGFSGKVRSLTTIIHEYITNSLDAAEENGILPSIYVEIKEIEKNERYVVIVEDNAGGIPKKYVGKALGKILAGTKFHRRMQARGQQGIGAAGCTLYSYITTGKPIKVVSGHKNIVIEAEVSIDINKNEPIVNILSETLGDMNGLKITAEFGDVKYDESQYGVFEYLKRTALVNPAVEITFISPDGQKRYFPRSSDVVPKKPKETLPRPLGFSAHDFYEMMKNDNEHRTIETAMIDNFARCSKAKTQELQSYLTDVTLLKKPTEITWGEADKIVNAIKKIKWIAPALDDVIPIGEEQIKKAILSIINPVHYAITQRPPKVYQGGIPFIVECALAYGGNAGRKNNGNGSITNTSGEIMRFANRVPLLFDAGGCAITEAVKTIDWKRYGIKNFDEEPITLLVNLSSVFVPYTGAGKQSIAPDEEIIEEIRFAIMETARNLQKYLSGQRREAEIASKKKALMRYVEQLASDLAELSEQGTKEDFQKKLVELVEKRYLSGEIPDESETESENEQEDDYQEQEE